MSKRASELVSEGAASKPKKTIGKMKVQGTKSLYSFHLNTVYSAIFWLYRGMCSVQLGIIQKKKMPLGINSNSI